MGSTATGESESEDESKGNLIDTQKVKAFSSNTTDANLFGTCSYSCKQSCEIKRNYQMPKTQETLAANPHFKNIKPETEEALIKALLTLKTAEEMRRFLYDICTPKEIVDLSDRWQVARLLDEGKLSYRDIHERTGVSVTTVGRVARFLQQENFQGYRIVLDRIKNSDKK